MTTLMGAAFCVAAYRVASFVTVHIKASAQVLVQPFTLVTETRNHDWNPVPGTMVAYETTAVRSDGSKAIIAPVGPVRLGNFGRTVTFADGRKLAIIDAIASKASVVQSAELTAALKARLLTPPNNCTDPGSIYQREDSVLGHSTAVLLLPPSGNVWTTVWLARDLGCTELMARVATKETDGSLKPSVEKTVVSLTLGEPDPRLFDEAAGYVERKPSEMINLYAEKIGVPNNAAIQNEGVRADQGFSALATRKAN